MLEYIALKNFKSIQDQKITLGLINVFIGPNGTGKSSISQSMALLKQSKQDVVWNGDLLNFEKFENILNNQTSDEKITIQFGGWFPPLNKIDTTLGITRIRYGFSIAMNSKGFSDVGFTIEGELPFRFTGSFGRSTQPKEEVIQFEGYRFVIRHQFALDNFIYLGGSNQPVNYDYTSYEKITNGINTFLSTYRNQLNYCKIIPSTRGFDQSSYQLLDEVPDIQSSRGVTRQSEMATTAMAHNYEILDKITSLAKQVIPEVTIQIRNLPQKRVQIINKDKYGEYSITDEGFGLNQSIYLFMQLVAAKQHSTIFIDEPEISLHPASQSNLSSVLVDVALKEKKQLIMTTHSEHIIQGLLTAVMDKKLASTSLNIFYFQKENGVTKITKLDVSEKGELKGGMKGFFEEDLNYFDKFIESVKKAK